MPVNTYHQIYRGLTQRLPAFIGPKYRELNFETGEIVPTMADLQEGIEQVSEDVLSEQGEALILADAMDIPMVEVGMSEDFYPVFMIAAGYYFTWKSTRSLQFAGRFNQIADRKIGRAARAIAERCHKFAAVGDIRLGQRGFLNSDVVTLRTTTLDPNAATADTLRSFLIEACWYSYRAQSGYTRFPSNMLISPALYQKATDLRMPDSSESVLLSVLRSVNANSSTGGSGDANVPLPTLTITQAPECSSAFLESAGVLAAGTNKDRVVVYSKDPEIVHRNIEPLGMVPEEWLGAVAGKKQYANFQCVTPTIWSQPVFGMYMDVPKITGS